MRKVNNTSIHWGSLLFGTAEKRKSTDSGATTEQRPLLSSLSKKWRQTKENGKWFPGPCVQSYSTNIVKTLTFITAKGINQMFSILKRSCFLHLINTLDIGQNWTAIFDDHSWTKFYIMTFEKHLHDLHTKRIKLLTSTQGAGGFCVRVMGAGFLWVWFGFVCLINTPGLQLRISIYISYIWTYIFQEDEFERLRQMEKKKKLRTVVLH